MSRRETPNQKKLPECSLSRYLVHSPRYEPKAKKAGKKDMKREIENLKRALKAATEARSTTEDNIVKKEKQLEDLQTTVADAQGEASKLEQMTVDLGKKKISDK